MFVNHELGYEMLILARSIVIGGIILCVVLLIKPFLIKQYIPFIFVGKRYYAAFVTRLLCGIIFLMAVPQAKIPWVAAIYGLGLLAKGFQGFLAKPDALERSREFWMDATEAFIRWFSVGIIVLSLVVFAML